MTPPYDTTACKVFVAFLTENRPIFKERWKEIDRLLEKQDRHERRKNKPRK